jgi:hypothetical protein
MWAIVMFVCTMTIWWGSSSQSFSPLGEATSCSVPSMPDCYCGHRIRLLYQWGDVVAFQPCQPTDVWCCNKLSREHTLVFLLFSSKEGVKVCNWSFAWEAQNHPLKVLSFFLCPHNVLHFANIVKHEQFTPHYINICPNIPPICDGVVVLPQMWTHRPSRRTPRSNFEAKRLHDPWVRWVCA